MKKSIDLSPHLQEAAKRGLKTRGVSTLAQGLERSEILDIAYDVRAKIEAGQDVLNMTVGDFAVGEFPIPGELKAYVHEAYEKGLTNYPPAPGVPELRESVRHLFSQGLGLDYPTDSVIIAGGGRPLIAATYLALVNEGDGVVYGLPSWNNHYYATITRAERREIPTRAEDFFFPLAKDIAPLLPGARLLCLNTPQNPTGTVMPREEMQRIAELVLEENHQRVKRGERELYVMFDQIYWLLCFDDAHHDTPVSLVPELAPYCIFVDGISKGFAATGLRVGWGVGPYDVLKKMQVLIAHLGAWAPKPEQVATARFLADEPVVRKFLRGMKQTVNGRLQALAGAIRSLAAEGHPVECIDPQGAIYLSVRLNLKGKKLADGGVLQNDEDIRSFVLKEAGIALIPFRCFGVKEDTGWFRASIGAVSEAQCQTIPERLKAALAKLS